MLDSTLFSLPGAKRVVALLVVCALALAACVLGRCFGLSWALAALWAGDPLASQATALGIFLCCYLVQHALLTLRDSLLERYAQNTAQALRRKVLTTAFSSHAQARRSLGTADAVDAALEGADQVDDYLHLMLPKLADVAVIPLVVLVAAFALDWPSGVVLLVVFPTIIMFMVIIGQAAQEKAKVRFGSYQRMSNHFLDTLRGLPTLKALGASESYGDEVYAVSEDFRRATMDTMKTATLSGAVLDLLATFGVAAVAMLLGLRMIAGDVDLFTGLACLMLAPEFFAPLRTFAGDFHATLDGKNALAHIVGIVGIVGESEPTHANDTAAASASDAADAANASETTKPAGMVSCADTVDAETAAADSAASPDASQNPPLFEARDVSFSYDDGKQALSHLSFRIQGPARVGIVGESGAGKSTLAEIVAGFAAPTEGEVLVNGRPLSGAALKTWHESLLYVPQDPYVFHASLANNVRFYAPHATDADVARAMEAAGLTGFSASLPQGAQTIVGEGARGLSGGQAQRIAIARGLVDPNRTVLVFDEPTAHLDIETEYELKQRMLALMEGRTVFFATHRLHWLADMDWILVLDGGRIAQQGTLSDLLGQEGPLARMLQWANGGEAR